MLETSTAKITGIPGASGWSQVHEFAPEDSEKFEARGKLFAVLSTKRGEEGEIDTMAAGRELIARFHEEYFGDITLKPFNALKSAAEKIVNEFRETWGDVEIAACSLVGDVVYSVAAGGAEVAISRGGILGTILKSTGPKVIEASGFPKKGDVILLGTKLFFERLPQGILRAAMGSPTPEDIVESFGPEARTGDGLGSLAAAVIKFEEKAVVSNFSSKVTPIISSKKLKDTEKAIKDAGKKAFSFLERFTRAIPQKEVYLKTGVEDEASSQNKKLTFSIAIILLLVLAVSVGFGIRQKKSKDFKSKYESILMEARSEVDEAISLASVSPERSRELFMDSEDKLSQLEAMKVNNSQVDELKKKIEESRGAILGEYEDNSELFLDLSLLSSGFKGDSLSASGGQVFILDKNGKKIVSVGLSTKKSKVVAGPNTISEAFDIASYEDRVFIVASDGVYEVGDSKTKVIEKTWGGEAFIRGYAGNLYVLDKSGNQIYRYPREGRTFGTGSSWLSSSTQADFTNARQWVIDGAMYVLFPNSRIAKFSLGSAQPFSLKGVVPEIGTVDAIYASEDNQWVYFLDRAGKRVVVTDKKGVYKAQYIADMIGEATNLVVSEADKKIILLVGDKLQSIGIKHI